MQDIVVDEDVFAEVGELVLHIPKEASDISSKMDDMCRLVLLKDSLRLRHVPAETAEDGSVDTGQPDQTRFEEYYAKTIPYLKSPSLLDRNIHLSSSRFLPNLLPTGSFSTTHWSARPTRPVPPVTRHTIGF